MENDGAQEEVGEGVGMQWLWVNVVGARNLESRQSMDAYCVVRIGNGCRSVSSTPTDEDTKKTPQASTWRSTTASLTADPEWSFRVDTGLRCDQETIADHQLVVEIFNEKNFFFDMFPTNNASFRRDDEAVVGRRSITSSRSGTMSDGEDTMSSSPKQRRRRRRRVSTGSVSDLCDDDRRVSDFSASDEALGVAEISLALLSSRASRGACATDAWYLLRGARSGEVRIRTLLLHSRPADDEVDEVWDEQLYDPQGVMEDHYGFRIPSGSVREWAHLRSYQACREQRRVAEWQAAFGSQFFALSNAKASPVVKKLAREGIPRHWRQRVYMALSGAREKQRYQLSLDYYSDLVHQMDSLDTAAFRQIELDIDRTFGHSRTKICTDEGRASLRRVLKAYSMHNPRVGYCQGLNFIVGFLTLLLDEESAFWLLVVICDDMYPGYYTPSMTGTQIDMLVLKQLIAEELPNLEEFTAEVGLPLELLGSQWLICLFTTTFPSETAFRIFDCILTEGAYFVFPVIMAHLRRLESKLLGLEDFQTVLSTMKAAENALLDADLFMRLAIQETELITPDRIARLREKHSISVRDEMERADRARALNRQLAAVDQIPAFSNTAANLLRFFHDEAEMSSRSDVAFVLTLLCHGLVWLAEHSKHLRR